MSVTSNDLNEGKNNDELGGQGSQFESVSARMEAGLAQGRASLAEWKATAMDQTRRAGRAMSEIAHQRPWQLIAGAVVIGVVFGLACAQRRSR